MSETALHRSSIERGPRETGDKESITIFATLLMGKIPWLLGDYPECFPRRNASVDHSGNHLGVIIIKRSNGNEQFSLLLAFHHYCKFSMGSSRCQGSSTSRTRAQSVTCLIVYGREIDGRVSKAMRSPSLVSPSLINSQQTAGNSHSTSDAMRRNMRCLTRTKTISYQRMEGFPRAARASAKFCADSTTRWKMAPTF